MNNHITKITSEDDIVNLVKRLNRNAGEIGTIKFVDYPTLKLRFEGNGFQAALPTRVMPPILTLQKALNKAYAMAKYGSPNTKRLTRKERKMLELAVKVEGGSTKLEILLAEIFNNISKDLNGDQIVIVLIILAFFATSSIAWKDWLTYKLETRRLQTREHLSEEETKRLQIMADLAKHSNPKDVAEIKKLLDGVRYDVARCMRDDDRLSVNGTFIMNGKMARKLAKTSKKNINRFTD